MRTCRCLLVAASPGGIMSDSPLLQLLPIRIVEAEPVLWRSLEAVL